MFFNFSLFSSVCGTNLICDAVFIRGVLEFTSILWVVELRGFIANWIQQMLFTAVRNNKSKALMN